MTRSYTLVIFIVQLQTRNRFVRNYVARSFRQTDYDMLQYTAIQNYGALWDLEQLRLIYPYEVRLR
jgi:hypothetical protein